MPAFHPPQGLCTAIPFPQITLLPPDPFIQLSLIPFSEASGQQSRTSSLNQCPLSQLSHHHPAFFFGEAIQYPSPASLVTSCPSTVPGIQQDPMFVSGCVRSPQSWMLPALGPTCITLGLTMPSKGRARVRGAQEGLMLLTCQLLLCVGQRPRPVLAVHSALVQDPVHSQDVHLGLLGSPGPRVRECSQRQQGLAYPRAAHRQRLQPDSWNHSPTTQGPCRGRLSTSYMILKSRLASFPGPSPQSCWEPSESRLPSRAARFWSFCSCCCSPGQGRGVSSHLQTPPPQRSLRLGPRAWPVVREDWNFFQLQLG